MILLDLDAFPKTLGDWRFLDKFYNAYYNLFVSNRCYVACHRGNIKNSCNKKWEIYICYTFISRGFHLF